ncbi:MAG: hypothetical protein Alpg2KO_11670 [Alphaproteobacteria bacterium]
MRHRVLKRTKGVSLVSYGLLVGLIGVIALAAITDIGDNTNDLFTDVSGAMEDAAGGGGGTSVSGGSSPIASGPSPSPSASPSPINITARYWRIESVGAGYNGGLNSGSELIMRQDGSWSTFPSATLTNDQSTGCSGVLGRLNNSQASITNTDFYACTKWDFVVDFGGSINVSGLGIHPQGNNPGYNVDDAGAECFNFPAELNIYANDSSATGPWGSPVTVIVPPAPTGSNGCPPDGVFPGAGNDYRKWF